MINRTYRTLNEPPRLLGFTVWQWLALLATVATTFGLVQVAGLDARPALTVMALSTSVVVAVTLAQEPGSVSPVGLAIDHARWLLAPKHYTGGAGQADKPTVGVLISREVDR